MENADSYISVINLLRIFLMALYLPIGAVCYWRLFPQLSAKAKQLATLMLALQLLLIVIWLELRPVTPVQEWLWNIDLEWNIQSVFAASQLALVGAIGIVGAWQAPAMPKRQRRHLLVVGLLSLFLGLDEYFSIKELLAEADWIRLYSLVGAAFALWTAWLAASSPKDARPWLVCLLFALALMAFAGIIFDNVLLSCHELHFLQIDHCLTYYTTPEEVFELAGAWLLLLAVLGQVSHNTPSLGPRFRRALFPASLLWFGLLALGSPVRDPAFSLPANPVYAEFESHVILYGYEKRADNERPVSVFLYLPLSAIDAGLGYSVHLVDQASGMSLLQRDAWAHRQSGYWLRARRYLKVFQNLIDVRLTPDLAANRALWVVLTLWQMHGDDVAPLKVLQSDQRLLSETQVLLDELVIPSRASSLPPEAPLARFDNGFALVDAQLPARAQAGETLPITFVWHAAAAGQDDLSQFLHFVHAETGALWNHDQQPLGPRLPTRLWYAGLVDAETWSLSLPPDLAPGPYDLFTGLYRLADLQRVAASDPAGAPFADARVPLGRLIIE